MRHHKRNTKKTYKELLKQTLDQLVCDGLAEKVGGSYRIGNAGREYLSFYDCPDNNINPIKS